MTVSSEWFREWFGDAYLSLYPHRDEAEAGAGVRLYLERSGVRRTGRVLDLACGAGRHLERLRAAGLEAVGMDLSAPLLREAVRRPGIRGGVVRGDMRWLPFADGAFAGLVSFFTSFGYFLTPDEDAGVISEIRRVLAPGAPFIMDYLNARRVIDHLEPETVSELGGRHVRQSRWVDGDQVFKRIEILGSGERDPDVFHERVRLYPPPVLEALLSDHDLIPEARFGSYDGDPFEDDSSRLILMGRAM